MLEQPKRVKPSPADRSRPGVDRHLWEIRPVQDVLWCLTGGAALWTLYALRGIFIPVFVALLFAYLANPLIGAAQRRWSWPRPLTVSLFLLCVTALTAGIVAVIGPLLSSQIQTLAKNMPTYATWFTQRFAFVSHFSAQVHAWIEGVIQDPLSMLGPLFEGTGQAFGLLGVMVGATVDAALLLFLIPLYFFFFAWHFDRMLTVLAQFIPHSRRAHTTLVLRRMDAAVSGFFRERLLIALISGALYAGAWAITGVPYWFLLGVGTGVLTLVPYVSAIGWPLAVLLKYLDTFGGAGGNADSLTIVLWPSVAYLVVQFVESWILTPWIQQESSDMNAVTLVIVLFVGGAVGGVFGLIFAIPIAACIKIALEEWVLPEWARWASEH